MVRRAMRRALISALAAAVVLTAAEGRAENDADRAARLDAATFVAASRLVGRSYLRDPLGEGGAVGESDRDPLFRLDAFDCLTFIETVLALVRAGKQGDAAAELDLIRYRGGEIGWARRRHLVIAQWLPGLASEGVIEDDASRVAGEAVGTVALDIDPDRLVGRWAAFAGRLGDSFPTGKHEVSIVPLERLQALPDGKWPTPAIAFPVHRPRPWLPYAVTHGVVLARDPATGRVAVFHASQAYGRVVRWTVPRWLASLALYRKWPLAGVAIFRPRTVAEQGLEIQPTGP